MNQDELITKLTWQLCLLILIASFVGRAIWELVKLLVGRWVK